MNLVIVFYKLTLEIELKTSLILLNLKDMFFDRSPPLWHYVKDFLGILTLAAVFLEHLMFYKSSIIEEEFILFIRRGK